jgi:hypothetical protein
MLRPNEVTEEARVQAWLSLIERELMLYGLSTRTRRYRLVDSQTRVLRIYRWLPEDLIDLVDDRLKMDGYRLVRRYGPDGQNPEVNGFISEGTSRPEPRAPYFEVMADVPCELHTWTQRHWSAPETRVCARCGRRDDAPSP